jgi:hypothetical protein
MVHSRYGVAATAGATFLQLAALFSSPLSHWGILSTLIMDECVQDSIQDPLIILDSDCLFWESCEAWPVDGLLASRVIPARAVTPVSLAPMPEPTPAPSKETHIPLPRLHTSLKWGCNTTEIRPFCNVLNEAPYKVNDLRKVGAEGGI